MKQIIAVDLDDTLCKKSLKKLKLKIIKISIQT